MPPEQTLTIEDQQAMELAQARSADERATEETGEAAKPKQGPFINAGVAILLLAFTGCVEILQWALDLIPYVGWIINIIIDIPVCGILLLWMTGEVAKGAPKKWYKAIYLGAAGAALPIIPGYLGAIIWLLIQDRKILGKVAGKLGETAEKTIEKIK